MNIIIIGCGKIGSTLAEQLNNEGHAVTIVDKNEQVVQRIATKLDVMGVSGNGAVMEVQAEAGIDRADVLIAVTGSDELNLLCCMIAKRRGKCSTIARVRNPEYDPEIDYLTKTLSISMIINPEKMLANEIVHLLRFPFAIEIDSFSRGLVDLIKVRLDSNSRICGVPLYELPKKLTMSPLICVVERGNEVIIPSGGTVLQANDLISFIAKPAEAVAFCKECNIHYEPNRSVFVIGGGRIAYYVATYMESRRSRFQLKIIEERRERCDELADRFPNATIIHGDGSSQQLLLEEGVEKADAFVTLTGVDEENIIMSLFASKLSKARLITKINRLAPRMVLENIDVGSVVNTLMYTSDHIVRFVRGLEMTQGVDIEALYKVANGKAEACEFLVKENNPKYVNIPFASLKFKKNVLVAAIFRNNHVIKPGGADFLKVNDRVVIITTNVGIHSLTDTLE